MSIHSDVKLVRVLLQSGLEITAGEDESIEWGRALEALRRLEARLLYPGITSESEREAAQAAACVPDLVEADDPAGEHSL